MGRDVGSTPRQGHSRVRVRARRLVATWALSVGAVGLFAGAAQAAPCPPAVTSEVFAAWGDPDPYRLIPGGDFEGSLVWNLSSGAGLFAENSPLGTVPAGQRSVRITNQGSITSPAFCVDADHPWMRFMLRSRGTNGKTDLRVEALWTAPDGGQGVATLGSERARGTTTWDASSKLPLSSRLPIPSGGSLDVRIRLSDPGNDSDWLIDDVYVDPRASR